MKQRLRFHILILTVVTALLSVVMNAGVAYAQDESAAPPAASSTSNKMTTDANGKKTTNLNFEDELVEGQTSKPELFYLFQKKNFNYKRLIRLRENFLPEMRRTSEDIQRGRSSN